MPVAGVHRRGGLGLDLGILGLFAAAAVAFVGWGWVELRVPQPMVDMRMMARRPVLLTNLTALLSGFAPYMTWVILPQFFQLPRGLPPGLSPLADYGFGTPVTMAGVWILPTSAAIVLSGPLAGMLARRVGSRPPLVAGMLFFAVGAAGIACSTHPPPRWPPPSRCAGLASASCSPPCPS